MLASPFALIVLAQSLWPDRIAPYLILAVVLIIAGLIGYSNYQNAKPFRIESTTSLPPEEALDLMQSTLARDGFTLGYRDSGSLVMSTDRSAAIGSTALLGCFSVWLALVYLITGRKRLIVEFDASASANGSILIVNGNISGSNLLRYVTYHLDNLPK